jgi:N-acetylmuramoyl-L-alanine amidase
MVGHATPVDYKGSDGDLTTYCKFDSVEAFIRGYWHFIESGPYDGCKKHENDPAAYIRHLAKKGYAADPDYVVKVLNLFEEARSLLGESAGGEAAASGTNAATLTRLAIVVGHNRVAKGASAVAPISKSEFAFNSVVAKEMKESASHYNIQAEIFYREPANSYREEIRAAYAKVAIWGAACAVELHFNSAENSSASRSEVLCRKSSTAAAALSQHVLEEIVRPLGLSDGGVKRIDLEDRGGHSVYALDGVPTALLEPFFGSNPSDCLRVTALGEEALALAYLRGVRDWAVASVA